MHLPFKTSPPPNPNLSLSKDELQRRHQQDCLEQIPGTQAAKRCHPVHVCVDRRHGREYQGGNSIDILDLGQYFEGVISYIIGFKGMLI